MNFLTRTPFAILGAFGLVSLASGVIHLEQNIADWVHVWQAVTYPIWEFLFGWVFTWINIYLSPWIKDYFSIGFIIGSGYVRGAFYADRTFKRDNWPAWEKIFFSFATILLNLLIWPLTILSIVGSISFKPESEDDNWHALIGRVALESFVYALLIIAASYALIFSSVSSPAAS